jgi:diadenosine tetraphosphate (Ap4A) HIT family hydrolase
VIGSYPAYVPAVIAAGQTVPHAHVHVIPRYDGDVSDPRGGVRWVIPGRAAWWEDDE